MMPVNMPPNVTISIPNTEPDAGLLQEDQQPPLIPRRQVVAYRNAEQALMGGALLMIVGLISSGARRFRDLAAFDIIILSMGSVCVVGGIAVIAMRRFRMRHTDT